MLINGDGDDDDFDDDETRVELSIHRLYIDKLRKLPLPNKENATEEEMIAALVKNFNQRKKTTGNFELEKTSEKDPVLLCNSLPRNNFQTRLYVSQRQGTIPAILKWYDSERKTGPIHLAWFFYRPEEIFALTTNHGYRLVHDYSEFDFPNKIAARLCTNKGFKVRRRRQLVGQDWEEAKASKTSERPSSSDLPSVYSTFTSELRRNASIRRVTDLSHSSSNVKFKACSVRFACRLKITDLPKVLNHLSRIANGLPTCTHVLWRHAEESEDEFDSRATVERSVLEISNSVFDSFLVAVTNAELCNELDFRLADQLGQAVVSGNFQDLAYHLGYKHHYDFALATNVTLIRVLNNRKEPARLSRTPSLKEILPYLSDFELGFSDASNSKIVLKEKVRIRFTTSTNKSKEDSLLSFLEGELLHGNKIYWRARNLWFELRDSYVATADLIFVEFLRQHYLKPHISSRLFKGFLTPRRGRNDCVREYTKKYEGLRRYFLPSHTSQPDLFDLMYADWDGQILIYFIAHNFMAHTASVCARINNCYEAIKAACEEQTGPFRRFYDRLESQRRVRLGKNFEIFQNRLKECNIIYALAPSSTTVPAESFCSRTLRQEKDRKVKITRKVLQDALRQLKLGTEKTERGLALVIQKDLLNEGFIDENDMVTTKFLYWSEKRFFENDRSAGLDEVVVYWLLTSFQSGFRSLRPRFELRYISQKTVYYTNFSIQDIGRQDVEVSASST